MDIIVIPDSHNRKGISKRRWVWLGNLIAERQPGLIMQMGDWWDMPSLCNHDRGKGSFYARRYAEDLRSGHEALDTLDETIYKESPSRYKPRRKMIGGNHDEGRILRTLEEDPRLEGTIGVGDLLHSGWEYHRFLRTINCSGVLFSHYFVSGIMGRPISGRSPARTLLDINMCSSVAAHSHVYDYSEKTRADGRKICGLVAGCFLDPAQREGYAGPSQKLWRNGITFLNNVHDGVFDIEFWSIERLRKVYD